jgi:hypothetical protein
MREIINADLGKGIVNIPFDPEQIPRNASQDSSGWISTDGQIELCRGRLLVGAEETASTYVQGEIFGYRNDNTAVHFRKQGTKIQYYNTATLLWADTVTGLTATADYSFSRYQSPAGSFVYATGIDGIYKIHTANPASYCSMYDSTKNHLGKSAIFVSRMFLWDKAGYGTNMYQSYIDKQDSTVYTAVAPEATAAATSGTLAFKAGDAKRSCFKVVITITASGEIFNDDFNGLLVGSLGGTGTINYITGAWTLSTSSAGTAVYFWEMTNAKGITDFTQSATRLAGEGLIVNQDEGGTIQKIEVFEGKYYSLKTRSVYEYDISSTPPYVDLSATNKIFRKDIGLPYWRASVTTGKGIIFMNTSNLDKPQLTILQKNINGDNLEPVTLANHFDFSEYVWDMCAMETFGEFIIFSGRTSLSATNNKLFLYNVRRDTMDILPYGAKTIVTNAGYLYIGDTITGNVYEILSGFDDDNDNIENYWIGNDELYGMQNLKKLKKFRIKGLITQEQILEISMSLDGEPYVLVGTVLGSGTYVDMTSHAVIASHGIGTEAIGGEPDTVDGNFYLAEIKLSLGKFRKRTLKLEATGLGYVSVNFMDDFGMKVFEQRIPKKYRSKQNVSVDGTLTDQ